MTYNSPSGQSVEELTERAVAALVREWGVSEDEARAALERAKVRERQLGPEIAHAKAWDDPPDVPMPRATVDLTEPVEVAP